MMTATPGLPRLGESLASLGGPAEIVLWIALAALLPALVLSITPLLRITIVLHFLRQALGMQQTPSNQVLFGLALFLTIFIMQPVVLEMYEKGWEPMQRGQLAPDQAWQAASQPLRAFLLRFAREQEIRLLLEIARAPAPRTPADLDLKILAPAYILSELKAAFQIGAVLFLPFLVIDLVVASVTLSAGMVQLPPVMISAPFKLLLFVLVDGWNLVVGSLVKGFY